jgi:sortase A
VAPDAGPFEPLPTPQRPRRPAGDWVLVGLTIAVVTAILSASVWVVRSPASDASSADAPTLVAEAFAATTTAPAPATTTTAATAPTAAAAPRTVPEAPPADPRARTPIVQVGEIRIPKIGLVHPVYEGVTLTVIDKGPGHWPGSAMPGQLGNAVFAGHRTTKTKPFRNVDQLVPGDEIIFTTAAGTFTYRMTRQEIVSPKDVWIVNPTPDATVTLFACHPPGSARQRIVVRGSLAASAPG